jgi:DNA gyrase subunit A
MTTKLGTVKKTAIDDFSKVRRSGLIALNLAKGDELRWIVPTTGKDEIIITTTQGQAIHFKETDVRPMGRGAAGVRGIKLRKDDIVVGMDAVLKGQKGNQLLVFSENGFGKRSDLKAYKIQKRGGSGIKTAKITPKTGKLVSAHVVNVDSLDADLICSSAKGQIIRVQLKSVSVLGRATQGVRVMRMNADDRIAATTVL